MVWMCQPFVLSAFLNFQVAFGRAAAGYKPPAPTFRLPETARFKLAPTSRCPLK
ncbi:hypothetical protein EIKCOROL_02145 [Eikenella corrodens ATCC 23834]|uniref:Uncharacterized protein n=1 Tax=Eikenella corrodens ATCC 23834 TaxID=546274 RepID=C0DXN4_EIKCO|nr:hypothetical protein EIKCOROL_02145 [Eikenella corrodens ATCC 23834]